VILAIACVANFMVIIDTSIVNVALPAMKAALGLSAADQQWVVNGYLITFGGFLLLRPGPVTFSAARACSRPA